MSTAIAQRKTAAVLRPLKVLVPLIKVELDSGDAAGIEHYRRAGEMLLEAKEQVAYGEWGAWLKRSFDRSHKQAAQYMRLAREYENERPRQFSSLSEMTGHRLQPARSWDSPVRAIAASVNLERLSEEVESRRKERQLMHDLAVKLIDIGYRVLAAKLHPDKGGSHEAMKRLNEVRRRLKEAI